MATRIYVSAANPVNLEHLKPNKKYVVKPYGKSKTFFEIKGEHGEYLFCLYIGCAHLDYGNWTVHKVEVPPKPRTVKPRTAKSRYRAMRIKRL